MSNPPIDPAAIQILDFWFKELEPKHWFGGSPELDAQMATRFKPLVEKALTTSELDESWTASPQGSLALILLLDQLPRNIFRADEAHRAWSGDAKALKIATKAIAQGFDQQIVDAYGAGMFPQAFFYLPFMHAEDLMAQVTSVSLFEQHLGSCTPGSAEHETAKAGFDMAKKHRDAIMKVGRFPKRNEPLGRSTTEQEQKFLEDHPHGF